MLPKKKLTFILIVGIISSICSYLVTQTLEREQQKTIFYNHAQTKINLIHHSISITEYISEYLRNQFLISNLDTPEQFQNLINFYSDKITGLNSVAWIPKVNGENKYSFIENARSTITKDYDIFELDKNNRLVSAKKSSVHFPILYQNSFTGSNQILGYDFAADSIFAKNFNRTLRNNEFLIFTQSITNGNSKYG